eukprot:CAMPEP_0176046616 /NCGR_PEP_ID=MMETSP0120_2-20121206/23148_1 /TAXON_ID=160619 /ORGANISM="Kryptoperidinium foliaceum, Strain CCMP 1326" /LENGTH=197 /DNA_ID=CAMNT_0017380029 /DNA_START=42 /DNA_END=635 /DNA_ORIENTATION=+
MAAGAPHSLLPLHRLASGLKWCPDNCVKNTFLHFNDIEEELSEQTVLKRCPSNLLDGMPARWSRDDRLEAFVQNIMTCYRAPRQASQASTKPSPARAGSSQASTEPGTSLTGEEGSGSPEAVVAGELPSIGSALHAVGGCKPCAWNRKAAGCFKGAACEFCHLCDDGAVAKKKRERRARVRDHWRQIKASAASDTVA